MFYQKLFTIKTLLENGVHYGHKKNRWNPKMAQYIYGIKNKVHIIDLEQTALMLDRALFVIKALAARNGRILFVSTKKNSADIVKEQVSIQEHIRKKTEGYLCTMNERIDELYKKLFGADGEFSRDLLKAERSSEYTELNKYLEKKCINIIKYCEEKRRNL